MDIKITDLSQLETILYSNGTEPKIVTNCQLAIQIQSLTGFTLCPVTRELNEDNIEKPYQIGNFYKTEIYVDPWMTWEDTRLVSYYE